MTLSNRRTDPATYSQAGVDIDAGNQLVEAIKPHRSHHPRPGADGEIGGFGGLFDLAAAGYTDPVLVAATDGVGTKLKIAIETGIHDSVGIDLVAMCVNDLVVQGAEPLFFLDYFATGKLETDSRRRISSRASPRAAELPARADRRRDRRNAGHVRRRSDYDLAGFAVGAAERGAPAAARRHRARATSSSASPRPASIPTASRWSAIGRLPARRCPTTSPAPFGRPASDERCSSRPESTSSRCFRPCASRRDPGARPYHRRRPHRQRAARPARATLPRASISAGSRCRRSSAGWPRPAPLEEKEMLRTFNCGVGMVRGHRGGSAPMPWPRR